MTKEERIAKRIEIAEEIAKLVGNCRVWAKGNYVRIYQNGSRKPYYMAVDDQAIDDRHIDIDSAKDHTDIKKAIIPADYIPFRAVRSEKDVEWANEFAANFCK